MFDDLLAALLKKGAHLEPLSITTGELAAELGVSQQTASRWLIRLEKQGRVARSKSSVYVKREAFERMKREYLSLQHVFDIELEFEFTGKVVKGLGEGAFFISMPQYAAQIKKKLGFYPYPGTLNVKISPEHVEKRLRLKANPPIVIEGFSKGPRTFGKIFCYRCNIEGILGALVFPARSTHGLNVLELIAPIELRKALGLKDESWIDFRARLGEK